MRHAAPAAPKSGTLLFRGGALGDFVITLPLIESLRRAFPGERFELVANPAPASLATAAGLVDAVHSIESAELVPLFARDGVLPAAWRARLASSARIVSFLHDPDGGLAANARRAGATCWLQGPPRPLDGRGLAAEQLAEPIERALELRRCDPRKFRLTASRQAQDEAKQILQPGPWIAIHPGSGSQAKNWPVGHWVEVVRLLFRRRESVRLILIGGEADVDVVRLMHRELPVERVLIVENAPLPRVAALIARCELYLGHDSGVSHLAAATGIPCVLLFGPSDPFVWAPPQANAQVIHASGGRISEITVAQVCKSIATIL